MDKIRSRVRFLVPVALACVLLLLLGVAGCSRAETAGLGAEDKAGVVAATAAPDRVAQDEYGYSAIDSAASGSAAGSKSNQPRASAEQLVVRNGALELSVDDIDDGVAAVRKSVAAHDGEIANLSIQSGDNPVAPLGGEMVQVGPASASITIRVAAERLSQLTKAIADAGKVISQSESADDVTEQAIDLEARLTNLRAGEVRLRAFLDRTAKVSELLEVERELARVRGEIESMDAQLTYLKRQAARATLTVTLSEPAALISPAGESWGWRAAITDGLRGAAAVLTGSVTLLIATSPVIALVVVAILIGRVVIRRRRGRAESDS